MADTTFRFILSDEGSADAGPPVQPGGAAAAYQNLMRDRPPVDAETMRKRRSGSPGGVVDATSPRKPGDVAGGKMREPAWYKPLADAFPSFGRAAKLWESIAGNLSKTLAGMRGPQPPAGPGKADVRVTGAQPDRPRPQPSPAPFGVTPRRPAEPPPSPRDDSGQPFRQRGPRQPGAGPDTTIHVARDGAAVIGKAAALAAAAAVAARMAGFRRAASSFEPLALPPPRRPGPPAIPPIFGGRTPNLPVPAGGGPLVLQGSRARAGQQVVDASGAPIMAGRVPWLAVASAATAVAGAFALVSGKANELVGRLASYSGILAVSQARAEVARIRQDISTARSMGPGLASFQDQTIRLELAINRAVNELVQAFLPLITQAAKAAADAVEAANEAGNWLDKLNDLSADAANSLRELMGLKRVQTSRDIREQAKKAKRSDLFKVFDELKDLDINDPMGGGGGPIQRRDIGFDDIGRLPV